MRLTVYIPQFVEIDVDAERQRVIQERVAAGRCIDPDCKRPIRVRGLCNYHYQQFKTAKTKPPNGLDSDTFEAEAISEGMVLGRGDQHRLRGTVVNRFASIGAPENLSQAAEGVSHGS
ncbi:hypothetical protein [Allorhodopirellula heiligendammensis]|uniref:Uncharacterized protein n=1 Tax=Allorhodopirellula heiligendammensis TaxID=2714739 RepID=A0A5C6C3D0_9BACT|nr:hypothetical protein [Allorhodopirellula heiligendammensis]TWU18026.1 hypothetical protein Poly21_01790 [Allorhodopirellula heiligendammensis]